MIGTVLERVQRLLGQRRDRDGRAPALERQALLPEAALAAQGQPRRQRELGQPQELLQRVLAQKVLNGWLQNRHQVLVPLTLRLGQLGADDVALLMRLAAASLLATAAPDEGARSALTRWLRSIGATDDGLTVFGQALEAPVAISTLLDRVQARRLEAYGYAVTVVASDLREACGSLFADFVAARLALPADSVRSINRRFRR